MQAKSDAARRTGAGAGATRSFVTKTAKEISGLLAEAGGVLRVMNGAHTELLAPQKRLRTARAEAGLPSTSATPAG